LFCFHQKKSAADARRIICETYSENVIALEQMRISLNYFVKNGDFDINNRKYSGRLAAMKEDELRKNGKKSWKMMENISINLCYIDFFIVIKKLAKTFAPT